MARPTTNLADWLGKHGLDQYAQTFAENNIEYSVLLDLTENDFEKLGVSLGHRKKFLRAIDVLRAICSFLAWLRMYRLVELNFFCSSNR